MFTFGRKSVSLDGTWKFCPDPMQRCRRQKWWKNPPKADSMFPCWDMEGLWDIQVPGTWNSQFDKLSLYSGHANYVRDFSVDNFNPDKNEAFLVFDGVLYSSEIYLNGHLVSKRDRGYSPFTVNVTDCLLKSNRIFVLLENMLKADRVPGEIHDWNNDGGIYNSVKLIILPKVYIENFKVETSLKGENAQIKVDVTANSRDSAATLDIVFEIPELGIKKKMKCASGAKVSDSFTVPIGKIKLWSPSNPKLYKVTLKTEDEALQDEIGLREIKTSGRDILLNGESIILNGLCVHSEFPGTGRTATEEGIALMIGRFKDLGVNFVRCAHYPYAEIFGRAMDKAGLMWWEEVPVYWLLNMAEPAQTERAVGMLEDAIDRDWNRASVVIWSVSNECCWRNPDKPEENNYPYWFASVKRVRELDNSRLVSCAEACNFAATNRNWSPSQADEFMTGKDGEHFRPMHPPEWYNLFDVLAGNCYVEKPGMAKDAYPRFARLCAQYNKPLMLSEFGCVSLPGAKVADDVMGSEALHAKILRECMDAIEGCDEFKGYCLWSLMDVRVPLHWKWYNEGKCLFRYGLLDENYKEKKIYKVFKDEVRRFRKK
jgi:beta-glucuronidase